MLFLTVSFVYITRDAHDHVLQPEVKLTGLLVRYPHKY